MEMRGAGDCDLGIVEIGTRPDDRKRLYRLRGAPEMSDERRVAAGADDLPVRYRHGVDAMGRFDDAAAGYLDHDRLHGGAAYFSGVRPAVRPWSGGNASSVG